MVFALGNLTTAPSEKDAKREFQFALENSEKLFELLKVQPTIFRF